MLDPTNWTVAKFAEGTPPLLTVVVDTEEEFDWSRPLSRSQTSINHLRHLGRAQKIFDRFNLKPTYVLDYAVVSQAAGYKPLGELAVDGRCDIGAHLHPWVNPPFDKHDGSQRTSFPGNLPQDLEQEKLRVLTEAIEERLGTRPRIYRAGRYGVGPATAGILEDLGYEIDTSVVPASDFRRDGGPDFRRCAGSPYWFGMRRKLLEVPLTVSWVGRVSGLGYALHSALSSTTSQRLHLPGVLARLGILERIRLTPEGFTLPELKRLTTALLSRGHKIFSLTLHSPSLVPGNTPYVRTHKELVSFLGAIEDYLEYFLGPVGGKVSTLQGIRRHLIPPCLS